MHDDIHYTVYDSVTNSLRRCRTRNYVDVEQGTFETTTTPMTLSSHHAHPKFALPFKQRKAPLPSLHLPNPSYTLHSCRTHRFGRRRTRRSQKISTNTNYSVQRILTPFRTQSTFYSSCVPCAVKLTIATTFNPHVCGGRLEGTS